MLIKFLKKEHKWLKEVDKNALINILNGREFHDMGE